MKVEWIDDDVEAFRCLHARVFLGPDETRARVDAAFEGLARLLKCPPSEARQKAEAMLTASELERFVAERVMAPIADELDARLADPALFPPECERRETCEAGRPFDFAVRFHLLPKMSLDLEGFEIGTEPRPEGEGPEKKAGAQEVAEALREASSEALSAALARRLRGGLPQRHLKKQVEEVRQDFRAMLRERGLSAKEYRIERRMKPQELVDELYEQAVEKLKQATALELAYRMSCGEAAEAGRNDASEAALERRMDALLKKRAGSKEKAERLYEEMRAGGKLCLLRREARKAAALEWLESLQEAGKA